MIKDHDLALGYVLEHDSSALPTFDALSDAQKKPIKFTQAKMQFNHGWLVQAEAPPGPLFSPFRKVVVDGGASPADVSFYFVHWVTDLAGAIPTPLNGCEKLAVSLPPAVLSRILGSIEIVQRVALATPTQLLHDYVKRSWLSQPGLGDLPTGKESVALLRLAVHLQDASVAQKLVPAFKELPHRPAGGARKRDGAVWHTRAGL